MKKIRLRILIIFFIIELILIWSGQQDLFSIVMLTGFFMLTCIDRWESYKNGERKQAFFILIIMIVIFSACMYNITN